MRKKQIVILGLVMFLIGLSLTTASLAGGSNIQYEHCVLNVNLIEQDPYPAVPGEYVKLVFQVSGVDNSNCNGTKFGLIPEYPFSLDNNETMRSLASYAYLPNQNVVWTIPYKVRVDKDAVNGDNEIKVRYNEGNSADWNAYITETFNISVEDSRTSFDAVVQEISGSDISIAIANIGKYTANSMVVRIPEQENFGVSGTNGQMVGNLASGDYTIVSFTLTSKSTLIPNTQRTPGAAASKTNNTDLKVQVDYTDGIGERRNSVLELPLKGSSFAGNSTAAANLSGFQRRQSNNNVVSKWYFWVAIAVVLGLGIYYYKKTSGAFHNPKNKSREQRANEISNEPDWIKKDRSKEKK